MRLEVSSCLCLSTTVFVVLPSLILCSSHSGDYKVLIWKNAYGSAKVGETTSFRAEVVLKPAAIARWGHKLTTDKNIIFEFYWKTSSHPRIEGQRTKDNWDSSQWRWTEAGNKTVFVHVRILVYSGGNSKQGRRFSSSYTSYSVTNQTEVTVSESEVQLHPYLVVRSFAGPKLPSDKQYALPKNKPVEFEVKFNDPGKQVTSVSIDWKFDFNVTVTDWPNTTLQHIFHKKGKHIVEVTGRVTTKNYGKTSFVLIKSLYVKAPVSLEVQHKHLRHKDKTVRFNISCNGSLPVSFHWCISKRCDLPPGDLCSPTVEQKRSCSLIVNHTFNHPGKYCVSVGVMNDVSGTNKSLMVKIPDDAPDPKHHRSKGPIAGLIVTLVVTCILSVVAIIAVRKWVPVRREKAAEKADFEFRDDDALSLSFGNTACSTWCGVRTWRKVEETVPLCKESRLYTF